MTVQHRACVRCCQAACAARPSRPFVLPDSGPPAYPVTSAVAHRGGVRRRQRKQRIEAVAAAVPDLTGCSTHQARRVVEQVGATLFDISQYADLERDSVYVYVRVVDDRVARVVSIGSG